MSVQCFTKRGLRSEILFIVSVSPEGGLRSGIPSLSFALGASFNGRTAVSKTANAGSTPAASANFFLPNDNPLYTPLHHSIPANFVPTRFPCHVVIQFLLIRTVHYGI